MEALDKAQARLAQRLSPDIFKAVTVKTVADIKRVLAELDPSINKHFNEVQLTTDMQVQADKGEIQTFRVTAPTRSKSKRDTLLEGFTVIKNRIAAAEKLKQTTEAVEINGRVMRPAAFGDGVNSLSWLDPLLTQWFGATRDGVFICWNINDGYEYRYCIFTHKLTRVAKNGN